MSTRSQSETSPSAFAVEPFVPRFPFGNSHIQTLAGNFLPRENLLPEGEERLIPVEVHSTGETTRVKCVCHWQRDRRSSLTLIIVHGLEGSSNSQYVVGTGTKAWVAGMNVVRMNMRNCGGTEHLGPTLYHSGMSPDVAVVAQVLAGDEKLQRVALLGYSMGGNLVTKLAGDWGDDCPEYVKAVAGVSPAMDLGPSADALHQPSNRVYEWKFLWGLMKRFHRKARLFPQYYSQQGIGPVRSLRSFDHEITARFCGFLSADDYYARSSASRVAERVRVPTLVLHAKDDPFIRLTRETTAKLAGNANVRLIETSHGGHCAFLASASGYDGYWAEKTVIEYFSRF